MFDGSDFPKQGGKSAGVARQYCGTTGQGGKLPGRDVSGLRQPPGPGVGGQSGCICPRVGLRTRAAVRCGGCAGRERGSYRSKTELALEIAGAGQGTGSSQRPSWVAGDDAFGMSPSFREGLGGLRGCGTCWTFLVALHRLAFGAFSGPIRNIRGSGRSSANPSCVDGQRRTMEERNAEVDELPEEAWREITVAEGSQGPRTYQFQRPAGAGHQAGASPVRWSGPSGDVTWTAASLATTCPTPQKDTPAGDPGVRGRFQVAH